MSQKLGDLMTALQEGDPDRAISIIQEIHHSEMLFLLEMDKLCLELSPSQTQRITAAINRLLIARSEHASLD